MKLSAFDYDLPKELIAQYPSGNRDGSRLLVLDRATGKTTHRFFKDIGEYFNAGDLLVLNNTKVLPARLIGKKETGGKVEALVLNLATGNSEYEVLLKPTRGSKAGSKIIFGDGGLAAEITRIENGRRFLKFNLNGGLEKTLDKIGTMPLPPYIKREPVDSDKERYQTVYAEKPGAVAAPTAGLHFTKDLLRGLSEKGIDIEYITLHVGYGTFKPVSSDDITKHKMEKEYFEINSEALKKIIKNKRSRIIAVGTTSCRVIESIFSKPETFSPKLSTNSGWTDLFIYPPYEFKAVDMLLTNFHLPKTTLLMLVSAFCGVGDGRDRPLLFKAYEEAIRLKYRFYSYGDAMLII